MAETVGEQGRPLLRELILHMVREQGPIPFERFMELSLYHPEHGFFTAGEARSTKSGDFLTSPEVSPLFGETLAALVSSERARLGSPFLLVEVGAGSGSLLRAILSRVEVEAHAVEASAASRSRLEADVPGASVSDRIPDRVRGVVLANELVDNLPMALAQLVGGRWRERWVGAEGDDLVLVDAPARPKVERWLESYAGAVDEGGWVEVQLAASAWLRGVLDRLVEGTVVLFDYGDTKENLVPRRRDGTLRTYRAHHLGPHPLDEPGQTDITADVNFTALIEVAAGLGHQVEMHRQDDFLAGLGLRERLSRLRRDELDAVRRGDDRERLRLRSARTEAETLLHPRGLGDFRVLVVRKEGTDHRERDVGSMP